MNNKVLTIAGSDCSGGAGIQADIKTITVHKNYAMSVITALTSQNTTGVKDIYNVPSEFIESQLNSVFTDIFPDSIKIGMLPSDSIISTVAKSLNLYDGKLIVLDPVMISTSGNRLMNEKSILTLIKEILPLTTLITPNIPEAEVLSGIKILNEEDMVLAADKISKLNYSNKLNVLIKGGHSSGNANDVLYQNGTITWFKHERINNKNTHGTGCTLSAAIASNLADKMSLVESIRYAKEFLTGSIKQNFDIGKGHGPLNHSYNIQIM